MKQLITEKDFMDFPLCGNYMSVHLFHVYAVSSASPLASI